MTGLPVIVGDSAPLWQSVLIVGIFVGLLVASMAAIIWSQRRRRRGEEAASAYGSGAEAMLRPPPLG